MTQELFDGPVIQRCPHDSEHPYSITSRALIRDKTLSPECRWLLIYLLSMSDSFKIRVKAIVNHVKGFIGRDKVYKIIREAISAGYMTRAENKEGNLSRVYYLVSETAKFKKCFRLPDVQDAEGEDAGSTHALDIVSFKKEYSKEEEDMRVCARKDDPDVVAGKTYLESPPTPQECDAVQKKGSSRSHRTAELLDPPAWAEVVIRNDRLRRLGLSHLCNQKILSDSDLIAVGRKLKTIKEKPDVSPESSRS